MNRAQVYKSAIEGMIKQHSSASGNDHSEVGRLLRFMQELAFGLHTREGSQFRNFDTAFMQRLFASWTATGQEEGLEAALRLVQRVTTPTSAHTRSRTPAAGGLLVQLPQGGRRLRALRGPPPLLGARPGFHQGYFDNI